MNAKISRRPWTQHKNPLSNTQVLFRLNPYAKNLCRQELRKCPIFPDPLISFLILPKVKLERRKKASATKKLEKAEVSASDAFKDTLVILITPPRPIDAQH